MSTVILVVVLILLEVTVGGTQNPTLSSEYICKAAVVRYTCNINSPSVFVQLIVEPFIPATGSEQIIINRESSAPISPISDGSGNFIAVRQVCMDPFSVQIEIPSNLAVPDQIICVDIGVMRNDSMDHNLDVTIVEPRSSVELKPMAANSSVGFVLICTEDTNTTRTLVNCSSGLCNEAIFDGTEQVIEIICDPKGVNITMNIYAINDCDELSDVLTRTIHLECVEPTVIMTIREKILGDTSLLASTITLAALLLVVSILGAALYLTCIKKKNKLTQENFGMEKEQSTDKK